MRRGFLLLAAAAVVSAQGWQTVPDADAVSWPLDAVQTADGFLWVASGGVLHRYDGRRMEAFGEGHGLRVRGEIRLAAEKDGGLLVGSALGLYRFQEGRFRQIYSSGVIFVAASESGLVALATFDAGLVVGRQGKEQWNWAPVRTPGSVVGQILFEPGGGMLFPCSASICEIAANELTAAYAGELHVRPTDPRLPDNRPSEARVQLNGAARDRWGRVWVRDWQRLYVADRLDGEFRKVEGHWMPGSGAAAVRTSPSGVAYWAAANGVAIGNANGNVEVVGGDTGFGGSMAYWDRQGSLWMGKTGAGLLRRDVDAPLYKAWGPESGLDSPAFAIHRLENDRTLAGTLRGIYELDKSGQRWTPWKETLDRFGGAPTMATALDGSVLFGVNKGPPILARMERDGRVREVYSVPPAMDGPNTYTLFPDGPGGWWIGSSRRLYRLQEYGRDLQIDPVPLPGPELANAIYHMARDESGRLLVPTNYGLIRLDGENTAKWTNKDGFLYDSTRFIARDKQGAYWISYGNYAGLSVARFNGTKINVRHVPAELGFGEIQDLLADRRGWIWIGDDRGIWVNRTGGLQPADFVRAGIENRQVGKGLNTMSLFEDERGRIWASGSGGTIRIDDPQLFVDEAATLPPLTVTGLQFQGHAGEPLTMQLRAPRLRGASAVRFRWRLAPAETEWRVSDTGEVRIPAVPKGESVIEAEAEHRDGYWRTPTLRYPVQARVPWWRSEWFWFPAGASAAAAAAVALQRRKKARTEAAAYAKAKLAFLEQRKTLPVFGGRYRSLEVIGSGGFATVYRAADANNAGREVAVKRLDGNAMEEVVRKQLSREVESLERIAHPGVVGVLDFALDEDEGAYVVLDYVPGPTLRTALRAGALPSARVASLARQLGGALAAAHAAGVVHRDLKPENVILRPDPPGDQAVIVDFGIAVCKPPGQTGAPASQVGGTLFYLAPEQLAGVARPSADIYSFAVMLCEALTGEAPAITEEHGLEGRAQAAEAVLTSHGFGGAARLIAQAMAFDAARRPTDAAAFGDAVAQSLS